MIGGLEYGTDLGSDIPFFDEFELGGFLNFSGLPRGELQGDVKALGTLGYYRQVAELGAKHGEFLVELAGMLPRVRIADAEVEAHGGGLFTVTVQVENTGFMPTSLQHGSRSRSVGPTLLQIQIDDDDILSGAAKTASVGILAGSGSRGEVSWFIRGREGAEVTITLRSMKAGHDTATITLR